MRSEYRVVLYGLRLYFTSASQVADEPDGGASADLIIKPFFLDELQVLNLYDLFRIAPLNVSC